MVVLCRRMSIVLLYYLQYLDKETQYLQIDVDIQIVTKISHFSANDNYIINAPFFCPADREELLTECAQAWNKPKKNMPNQLTQRFIRVFQFLVNTFLIKLLEIPLGILGSSQRNIYSYFAVYLTSFA